ncbi:MAG: RecQ family ATP-dependent DNA helicase [Patescibacteria group bacterium]|nr:RecQ family ATP-dependent DNA helicase [Patescibacteria group bacterium]
MTKQKQQTKELLKIHYGFISFRPGQEQVIDNILANKSTVVIMPTGGGKSLCFQLPALVLNGVTIIVSPLIALMKDQVDSLNQINIPATFINSSISLIETNQRLEAVKNSRYKLLYVAPERFYNQEFMQALSDVKVSLFAIDEAHCISQWGHDFRPSYLKLRDAISKVGSPPVMALTATATPEVRQDIIKQLGLNNPELVITGFARPNLQFGVIRANDAQKPQFVIDAIQSAPDGTGIIYVGTRARVDDLLQFLLEHDIKAASYHAGMEPSDRKWVQDNFMSGKIRVIVATNAFGLGIDKPNIRFVIHYDMPGTIEAYYQESGRAGRDGKPSFCLMLYNPRDRHLREFFIKGDNPPPEIILEIYKILTDYDSDTALITYAELAGMLSESVPEMAIGTALKILEREGYITRPHEKNGSAYLKLTIDFETAINSLGQRAKVQHEILNKLYNRFTNELKNGWQVNFDETAEILKIKKESLMRLIRKLADDGMVEYQPPFRGTEINILKRVNKNEIKINFIALREKLKNAYRKLDQLEDYVYHSNCRQKFILDYFGDNDTRECKVCDNCLVLKGYQRKNPAPAAKSSPAHFNTASREKRGKRKRGNKTRVKLATKLTQLETFDLYKKGMAIEEMAQARNLKPGTIIQHLCYLIKKGLPVEIDEFVSLAKQKKIIQTAREVGFDKLTPIKDCLGEEVSWDEIRLVLAKLKKIICK